jgi:hypothetical protein
MVRLGTVDEKASKNNLSDMSDILNRTTLTAFGNTVDDWLGEDDEDGEQSLQSLLMKPQVVSLLLYFF